MPTYAYACTACGHAFDLAQKFTDDALTECPQCAGRLRKVYNSIGVTFKGSGFYRTDSRAAEKSASGTGSGKSSTDSASGGSEKSGSDSGTGKSSSDKVPAKVGSDTSGSSSSGSSSSGSSSNGSGPAKPSGSSTSSAAAAS